MAVKKRLASMSKLLTREEDSQFDKALERRPQTETDSLE
jgi:hypothetical protein